MRKLAIALVAVFVWFGFTPTSATAPFGSNEVSATVPVAKLNYYRTPDRGPWCEHACGGGHCCEY